MTEIQQTFDVIEILKVLPHRYPFVMVDRIIEFDPGKSIVGLKNVTFNEPFFQGHFPGVPIMPGVLILEGMAQAAAVLAYYSDPEKFGGKLMYFAGMDGVRFRQKVVPGDQLIFKIEVIKFKTRVFKLRAKALVENNLVAEAELLASFG
ncbi:MAG: 3-hydroxyacyl-ACP dehydratase FabZ [Proteobacteria bacterium]|nr:3-hydroxyacyl-ACP dehydratase FabZ [Pseudomonadota bacterium]MBU1688869.1 3-hydroxyacyl-ACP dehydratase FabZ [Pseudomonadota bacterium]